MADKFEKKLFQLAGREKIIPPETLGDKIEIILTGLPESGVTVTMGRKKIFSFKMNFRKALVLSAALVMLLSITATAAAGFLRQRMEALNREKMEEYFAQKSFCPLIRSRGYFPKGNLLCLTEPASIREKVLLFLKAPARSFSRKMKWTTNSYCSFWTFTINGITVWQK